MGLTDVTDLAYLVPRCAIFSRPWHSTDNAPRAFEADLHAICCRVVAWILLWLVALFDAVRHRQTKRRGYQLQRGIVICLFAYVVQDVLLLSYSSLKRGSDSRKADDVLIAFHVFSDLADSIFMVSLSTFCARPYLLRPRRSTSAYARTPAGASTAHSCRLLVSATLASLSLVSLPALVYLYDSYLIEGSDSEKAPVQHNEGQPWPLQGKGVGNTCNLLCHEGGKHHAQICMCLLLAVFDSGFY